ncbi:MAG: tetratricopeptide repeat protein [Nanoarchaeota archaeon]
MQTDLSSIKKILSSKYTAIVILIIISIGVYLNTLPNEFVYDDEALVLKNHWIRDAKYIPEIFLSSVWEFQDEGIVSNHYRPLMHIIYMIDYHIFGFKPWGFHLTNIIFHAGVSVLVFLIVSTLVNQLHDLNSKFIPNKSGQNSKSNPEQVGTNSKSKILTPPFIAALLFATHPIHTEAVACISGLPDLSFTLCYLLSFYLYINSNKRYTPLNPLSRGENKNKRWGKGLILSVLFFFLAALCKELALTLPILLLVYDYSLKRESVSIPQFMIHNTKKYLPYLILTGLYFILRISVLGGFAPLKGYYSRLSNYQYFINIFPLFTRYLEKLLLPINMNAFYIFHPISSIFEWKGIIALIITSVFIFLVYFFRKNKVVFLCLLWIVIPLLPVLYIPVLAGVIFAERYLYLPSIGFVVLVALAIERVSQLKALRQFRHLGIVIVSILIILTGLYSTETIKRNYVWRDNYSLWTDTVEKSPDAPPAHHNLGVVYSKQGRLDEAIREYMTAIKLRPDAPIVHHNLGNVYSKQGRFDEAIKEYMIALRLKADYVEAYNELGIVYSKQGRFDEAIKEYITALNLKPDFPEAHNNLGNAYSEQGEIDKAIEHYQIALKLKPDYSDAHYNLGIAYQKKGLEHLAK